MLHIAAECGFCCVRVVLNKCYTCACHEAAHISRKDFRANTGAALFFSDTCGHAGTCLCSHTWWQACSFCTCRWAPPICLRVCLDKTKARALTAPQVSRGKNDNCGHGVTALVLCLQVCTLPGTSAGRRRLRNTRRQRRPSSSTAAAHRSVPAPPTSMLRFKVSFLRADAHVYPYSTAAGSRLVHVKSRVSRDSMHA
jgi:hypothetical protein